MKDLIFYITFFMLISMLIYLIYISAKTHSIISANNNILTGKYNGMAMYTVLYDLIKVVSGGLTDKQINCAVNFIMNDSIPEQVGMWIEYFQNKIITSGKVLPGSSILYRPNYDDITTMMSKSCGFT